MSLANLLEISRFFMTLMLGYLLLPSFVAAQIQVDFTRASDDEPLQEGWLPFQGDGVDPVTESFDLGGRSIDVTVEGNTHWRDYRAATGGFAPYSDLLSDGPLCNDACDMAITFENLTDGDYDFRAYLHTTQFGPQDGRPFTPFEIALTDGRNAALTVNDGAIMSDDSSLDLSTETIPFTVVGGAPVQVLLQKPGGDDHMQLAGFELGERGSLADPPTIDDVPPPPPVEITLPDGLNIDFSRDPDEFPLQDGWESFVGEGTDVLAEEYSFEGATIEVAVEGNTHWRDYRAATGDFAGLSDLLSDGPLCNAACEMTVVLDGLSDGEYELTTILHTTQFGEQDGRPFTPFEIRLTDGVVDDLVINEEAFMSDDSSDELSLETIPISVVGGSSVTIAFEKLEGNDHFALPGIILSSAGLLGDFNGSGSLDANDIDLLNEDARLGLNSAMFDLDANGTVDENDREKWVTEIANTWFGDSNLDGQFNSSDFVAVFTAGKFEQDVDASWSEGDWNGDGRFSSGDFVIAFQGRGFEAGPRNAKTVPEPAGMVGLLTFVSLAFTRQRRLS